MLVSQARPLQNSVEVRLGDAISPSDALLNSRAHQLHGAGQNGSPYTAG